MTTTRQNVYRCEWCRCEVYEDIEYVPGCGDRGYCGVCGQTVSLKESRELRAAPEHAGAVRDDSERAESTSGQRRRRQGGGLGR